MAKLSELIDNNNGPISYDTAKEYNVWSRPKARIISEKYTKYKPLQIWLDDHEWVVADEGQSKPFSQRWVCQ